MLALSLVTTVLVVSGSAASQQPATGFVLGRVLDASTGQPISGAQVTLAKLADTAGAPAPGPPAAPPLTKTVVTSGDGNLLFRELTSGRYSLTVTAIGYMPGGYLQKSPADTRAHPIELGEGERRTGVDVRLWKLGSISGAVVDEAGRPALGAHVTIRRRASAAGRLSLVRAASATTDDRGMYVASGLPPAEYVVGIRTSQLTVPVSLAERYAAALEARPDPNRAPPLRLELMSTGVPSPGATGYRIGDWIRQISDKASIGYAPPPSQSDGRVFSYRSTYFANADSPIAATSVTLGAGEDRRGVDLRLRLEEGRRVSGRLVGADGPVPHFGLRLLSPGTEALGVPGTDSGSEAAATVSDINGAFTFLGVLPGTYQLRATHMPMEAAIPGRPTAPVVWAEQSVTVDRDDVSDLTVSLKPGLKVTGRVHFSGATAPPQNLTTITIGLRAAGTDVLVRGAMSYVSPDGTFTTIGDVPRRYFLEVWPPRGWVVRSITYSGRNVADEPFDLSADAHDVVLTFTDVLSRLSGTVTNANGSPDSQANAIVFPADSDGWRRDSFNVSRSRRLIARTDGTFGWPNIPAGAYYVVAVDDAVAAQWANPAVLEKLVRGSTRVTIVEGDNKNVALKTFVVK
jgi:hypothetical protein